MCLRVFFSLCFLVSVCFFICKWHGRSFLPGRNRETTFHQHKSHHVMTVKICHFMCVFAFVFYHSLLVDLSYIILFFPPKLFLFVCVCQIKQTTRQPRSPDRIWPLFHLKHNMEPLPSCLLIIKCRSNI